MNEPNVLPIRFLIENKIIAPFGLGQIERYYKRSQKYFDDKACAKCFTVLLAPECYYKNAPFFQIKQKNAFDYIISYDEILEFLEDQASKEIVLELSSRYHHKARILKQAIEKGRRPRPDPIDDPLTHAFKTKYRQFASEYYPHFQPTDPFGKNVSRSSDWIYLRHPTLKMFSNTIPLILVHKYRPGHDRLDLQFTGWGKYNAIIWPRIQSLLEYKMQYSITNKTAIISIPLIPIDINKSFEEESPKVRAALEEASRLIFWLERNQPRLLEIVQEIKKRR
ncbi:MAG: hypothetical protein ACE15F_24740 [bacterium]